MKLSVYITSYNQHDYLRRAIQSVLSQTRRPDEIVIVDDASTDGSQALIKQYEADWPGQIIPVLRSTNGGVVAARNDALRNVTGDVLSFLDGDDWWREDKLANELRALETSSDVQWAYSIPILVAPDGTRLAPMVRRFDGARGDILMQVLCHDLSLRDWTAEMSLVRDVGHFDPQLDIFEDWDFKIRMAQRGRIAWMPRATVFYRQHDKGLSRSSPLDFYWNLSRVYNKHANLITSLPDAKREQVLARKRRDYRKHIAQAAWDKVEIVTGELKRTIANLLS